MTKHTIDDVKRCEDAIIQNMYKTFKLYMSIDECYHTECKKCAYDRLCNSLIRVVNIIIGKDEENENL